MTARFTEYDRCGKELKAAREDLRLAQNLADRGPKKKRPELRVRIQARKTEIKALEERRKVLLEGSGLFREKLLNKDRFTAMKSPGAALLMEVTSGDGTSDISGRDVMPEAELVTSAPATLQSIPASSAKKTPRMGKGYWKLNSSLLEEVEVRQSFEDFLQSQVPLLGLCSSKSEWWEIFKKRVAGFFHQLSSLRSLNRYRLYQGLRRKLELLVSTGGSREDISRVKSLLMGCQYDRHASLVFERDYGRYRSPDPYRNCKMSVSTAQKSPSGLPERDQPTESSI
ncbi:uncharacterized protein LOC130294905 [Hyla sarda]|uniref:uncharacterized protein LOC130294905 n=1 Tax=Hyla sarda TaxID=327740 RepID=UPI0024C2E7D4|nr:uncharacterized protein LOC130294905 [Hyla sarda]